MDQSLPVLSKALDILESFIVKPAGLIGQESFTARELQDRLRIPRATLYRQLRLLEQRGYLRRDSQGGPYKLGYKLLQLAIIAERQMEIVALSQDFLIRVLNQTHETSSLAVLDGREVIFVKSFDSLYSIQVVMKVGFRAPCHCTAAGKAILAFSPEKKVQEVLDAGLGSYTEKTVTRADDFRTQLRRAREEGFALNLGELRENSGGIAAPVFDYRNEAIASIGIVAPLERLTPQRVPGLGQALCQAACDLSLRMGAVPQALPAAWQSSKGGLRSLSA